LTSLLRIDTEVARAQAEIAKLGAEVDRLPQRAARADVDRERRSTDWTSPPSRRELN
jgi:hypothetical protein